uniref:Multidrug resistance-associated protein 5 n=1 Tax=Tanacetum cinerariifolium TaxID=118510 RepID=A0A699J1N3_TANCI|nr:multidrug resistance-associated protein 5 [Tanacetum cinerariifolium]GFA04324.1 multidrug resistance-associated protein 5 [Tanacetum cinerariifolium]
MPGRPRKKRFRASHETKSNTRISRAGIIIKCHNCLEFRYNKKGCKKEPIVPKEKKKGGRPKKIPTTEPIDSDNDIPPFMNNDINEFEIGASVYNVGRFSFKKKKKFGSSNTGHVKMRGGKTKGGRLFPAQRLGRMGCWLGMNGATSDTIEETEPYQPSLPVKKIL